MGTAAASAGAAGPEGLQAGRSSRRTKPEYPAAGRRRNHATFGSGPNTSVRRPGLGARLLATSDEARAGWYIADYSAFHFGAQVTEYWLETKLV